VKKETRRMNEGEVLELLVAEEKAGILHDVHNT
jgi:TusA-related sulfurtransferase